MAIPCIVNTRSGTIALRTGDRVRMDGTTGTIQIIGRAGVRVSRKAPAAEVTADLEAAASALPKQAEMHLQIGSLYDAADEPAAAVSELSSYDWQSREAREDYEKILAGKPDVPVWFDLPETGGTLDAVIKSAGIFTGDLTAQQFAQNVQKTIKPNPNL